MTDQTASTLRELQHHAALVATLPRSHPQFYDRLERLEQLIKCYHLEDYFDGLD